MARLKVNGVQVEVDDGATLLDAAEQAGVEVPTLCHTKETGPLTSCMICIVKDLGSGRTLPACSAQAIDGMEIDTECEEVRTARREILLMLLSEHVGDCEAPCSRICPAGLNIPRMLRHIAAGDLEAAARIAKRDLIFPATLGWLCTAPCEKGCRRADYDTPISIRNLHREVAERFLNNDLLRDTPAPATGKVVAIVGAGVAGLAAASVCARNGHACRVYEKRATACDSLRSMPEDQLPRHVLDAEIRSVAELGVAFVFECEVGARLPLDALVAEADVVILACDVPHSPNAKILVAHEDAMLVRAVAHGKGAALQADAFLRNFSGEVSAHRFNSRIGGLKAEELGAYASERLSQTARASSEADAFAVEAQRCLHCDCLKPVSCKLRRYADEYRVGHRVKRRMERPAVAPIQRCDDVLFEPGKCIKCGICVEITRRAGKDLGLTFVGRGLASRVRTAFGESLARGLGAVAVECVRACPTGALAFRNEEETA